MIHHLRMARNDSRVRACPRMEISDTYTSSSPQRVGTVPAVGCRPARDRLLNSAADGEGSSRSSRAWQGSFRRSYLLPYVIERHALASCTRTSSGAEGSRAAVASDRSSRSMTRSMARSQHQIGRIDRRMDRLRHSKRRGWGAGVQRPLVGWGFAWLAHRLAGPTRPLCACRLAPTPPAEAPGGATRRARRAPSTPTPVLAPPRVRPA